MELKMERVHLKELMENKIVVRVNQKDEIRYLFKICSIYSPFLLTHLPTYFITINGETFGLISYDINTNHLSDDDYLFYQNDVKVKCTNLYPNIYKIY